MRKTQTKRKISRTKIIVVGILYFISSCIIISGSAFIVFSFVNDIYLKVLNSSIHGAVFGAVITYLGVRYFISVNKLKLEVFKDEHIFSWSNFKNVKKADNNCLK